MKKFQYSIILITFILLFSSCQDVINIDLAQGEPQLAVDAFLNNLEGNQTIRLTITSPYLDNSPAKPALGAVVTVTNLTANKVYNFIDVNNNGNYTWIPPVNTDRIGSVGDIFALNIIYQGETFTSSSKIGRVPAIDSLVITNERLLGPEGLYAELYATDFVGREDFYWIKAYKNGKFNNRVTALTTAANAGFDPTGPDGIPFLRPIRRNAFDFVDNTNNNPPLPPLAKGDRVRAELISITPEAFFFLRAAAEQMQNGGLFARPPANVPSNIKNANPNSTKKALGCFVTSAVSVAEKQVQ
jgi:hypothetical protein